MNVSNTDYKMCDSNETFQAIGLKRQQDGDDEQSEKRLRFEHNQTLAINRLPFEVMKMILDELPLNDLLACERVCQHWNGCVKLLNLRRMIIVKVPPIVYKSRNIRPRKWFFIDTNEWWPSKELPRTDLQIDLNDSFLLNLRQLRVCDPPRKHLPIGVQRPLLKDTNFINQLINLEVLEVSRIDQGTIHLPNLTCLAIHRLLGSRVRIDCPKLTSFRTKDGFGELPRFLHPQTVTHLYAVDYSPAFAVFNSLKYLSLESSAFHNEYGNNDADQFLTAFPKLRVLSQRPGRNSRWNEQSLQVLLRRKNALKRDNLTIIFFGVPIDDPAQLDESNAFRLLMQNYDKLRVEELKRVRSLSYPDLMDSVDHRPEQLPVDIQRTFCNIQKVTVGDGLKDEDALLRLLGGFGRLRILYFQISLGEAFFEKLAAACPPSSHKCLELYFNKQLVSFDFIFRFGNLVCLKLFDGAFEDEFIRRVFDEFGTFELFFYEEYNSFYISRPDRLSSFDCSRQAISCQSFDSLDDLLRENAQQIERLRKSHLFRLREPENV